MRCDWELASPQTAFWNRCGDVHSSPADTLKAGVLSRVFSLFLKKTLHLQKVHICKQRLPSVLMDLLLEQKGLHVIYQEEKENYLHRAKKFFGKS